MTLPFTEKVEHILLIVKGYKLAQIIVNCVDRAVLKSIAHVVPGGHWARVVVPDNGIGDIDRYVLLLTYLILLKVFLRYYLKDVKHLSLQANKLIPGVL